MKIGTNGDLTTKMAQWTGTNGDLTTQNDDLAKNNDVDNSDLSSKSGDFTNKLRDLSKNFLRFVRPIMDSFLQRNLDRKPWSK